MWEQTMIQEQKMLELSTKAFELSIENHQNGRELEIMRHKLRKKNILGMNKTREDLEELEYTNEALRILEKGKWDKLNVTK